MPARDVCTACGYPAVSRGRCWACGARDATVEPHVVDEAAECAERERSSRAARDIWDRAKPATRSIVETYFVLRGLPPALADLPALRFTWACHHPSGFKLPALVALVSDVNGEPRGVHRTYLRPDGAGKAPIEPQKATLGPYWGGAVRLHRAAREIVVGEGIETSLSAGLLLDLPAWAACTGPNLGRAMALPPEVTNVIIAADHDGVGCEAAHAAALRWLAEGRRVRVALPDKPHSDFNDVLREKCHG